MPAIGIVGLALLVLVTLLAIAPHVFASEAPAPQPAPPPSAQPAPQAPVTPLTREQLAQKLQKLAETPAPKQMGPSATCYRRAAPPQTADYVCPKDGSRTHYSRESGMAARVQELDYLRNLAALVPGVSASIDTSEFCQQCSPHAPAHPEPILEVKLKDGGTKRTRGVTSTDLSILREFLNGRIEHDDQSGATPLKDHLPRIRELLGLDEKPSPKPSK